MSNPDVRPPVENHPHPGKRPGAKRYPPMDIRDLCSSKAAELFAQRGGSALMQELNQVRKGLLLHDRELDRAQSHENPDKFRWLVNPGMAARLRKERKQLDEQIDTLIEECEKDAAEQVAQEYPAGEYYQSAVEIVVEPAQGAKEAATSAPLPEVA